MNKTFDIFFDGDENPPIETKAEVKTKPLILSDDELKARILGEFSMLSSMSVPEYTLYNKWIEVNSSKWADPLKRQRAREIESNIWAPEDVNDYMKLQPKIVRADNPQDNMDWLCLRTFTSTMAWRQNPGRCIRYYVIDEVTGKYLGVCSIASDFISLKGRDDYIKWTLQNRNVDKMLGYTAMGSTIVPTQPLGYNYVGGKLLSLLICSKDSEDIWNNLYPHNKLVGFTTTSLYGGGSQYDRLVNWKKLKSSTGQIALEPTADTLALVREWTKYNYPDRYGDLYGSAGKNLSRPKTKLLTFVYKQLKIKTVNNNAPRGIYWCPLYENSEQFLRRETDWDGLGKRKFDNSVDSLVEIWKNKYAKKRIDNIIKTDRFNPEHLYYVDLMDLSWEEAREKYLPQIGR